MATRPQQVVILRGILDKIDRALRIAQVYQQATVNLVDDQQDTAITITSGQQAGLAATFDSMVAGVKSDATTL